MENMKNELKTIGLHYGFEAQSQMFIEEMSELTKALCKYNRTDNLLEKHNLWDDIEEELADVLVLAGQFLEIWADKDNVDAIVKAKVERQLKRIYEEEKNE